MSNITIFDKPLDHEVQSNSESISTLQNEVGKVINGNTCTDFALNKNDYVIVKNSTINDISDGLYIYSSSTSKSAGDAVSTGELTAVSGGGLNALNSNIANQQRLIVGESLLKNNTKTITLGEWSNYLVSCSRNNASHALVYIVARDVILAKLVDNASIAVTVSSGTLSITNNTSSGLNLSVIRINGTI